MKVNTLWGEEEFESKVCIKCGEEKLLTDYGIRNNRNEYRNDCKKCQSQVGKEVKLLEKNHPYPDDGHQCPMCLRTKDQLSHLFRDRRVWVLDHDHKTKQFRGWICNTCNTGLSRFGDDIETLQRAIVYLRKGSG